MITIPIPLGQALLRGGFMADIAAMEWRSVPMDAPFCAALTTHREAIRYAMVGTLDRLGFYDGTSFRMQRFESYLQDKRIYDWPRLASGNPDLDKDTLKEMALVYTDLADFRLLRRSLACLKDSHLIIGSDGRNRAPLFPFGSVTGRCQPSSTAFIFGWPRAWRRLIRPGPGMALAYCDYAQEEFAIAADLSGDAAMIASYQSGDCYIDFAKRAGAVPAEATKDTHPIERDLYKTVILGIQYLMTAFGLGRRIRKHPVDAQRLIDQHRRIYAQFWRWSDAVAAGAQLHGRIVTDLGWPMRVTAATKERTVRNYLMQATGGDILRLACREIIASGIRLCAPVHDAVLIEAPISEIDEAVGKTKAAMKRASRYVLRHLTLGVDAKVFCYPARFTDRTDDKVLWPAVITTLREQTGRDFDA